MADQLGLPENEGEAPRRRVEDHLPVHAKSALDQSAAYLADLRDYSHGEASPILVPVAEAARLLSVSHKHLWRFVRRGKVPSVRIGRRVLIPRGAVEALAKAGLQAGVAEGGHTAEGDSAPEVF